jgi:hypothetical protein
VYDYVDEKVPMLSRMYGRRVKGYKDLGFLVECGHVLFSSRCFFIGGVKMPKYDIRNDIIFFT